MILLTSSAWSRPDLNVTPLRLAAWRYAPSCPSTRWRWAPRWSLWTLETKIAENLFFIQIPAPCFCFNRKTQRTQFNSHRLDHSVFRSLQNHIRDANTSLCVCVWNLSKPTYSLILKSFFIHINVSTLMVYFDSKSKTSCSGVQYWSHFKGIFYLLVIL